MYILMAASECAPAAKVGGLADVVFGLSRELELLGHTVEIILPKYDCLRYDQISDLVVIWQNLPIQWGNTTVDCTVFHGTMSGRSCMFIESNAPCDFFCRNGYYGFPDDDLRFAFFSKAVLEFLTASGKRPDIIHSHDWQTALIPILLHYSYQNQRLNELSTCHTVHNFKIQGTVGNTILATIGMQPFEHYSRKEQIPDTINLTTLNLTKEAINCADFVTTVSPRYAWEARFTDQGHGLGHVLFRHREKFGGIINGLDCTLWDPQTDTTLPHTYSADNLEPKYRNKRALRKQLQLRDQFQPIIAYIGDLTANNGIHLIRHALFYALEHGAQFVLLGSSMEAGINTEFSQLKHNLKDNRNCAMELAFDNNLARLIYAGSDMTIIPSLIAPCGQRQMIALRYGSVPIVNGVGGLVDTVFDRDYSDRPQGVRNGYVFHEPDYQGLEAALQRAIGLWHSFPGEFRNLIRNGMNCDVSWRKPAQDYLDIYQHIAVAESNST